MDYVKGGLAIADLRDLGASFGLDFKISMFFLSLKDDVSFGTQFLRGSVFGQNARNFLSIFD